MSLDNLLVGLCRQPMTGYELKTVFDVAIRHFWSAGFGQLYPTLHRLEAAGMLESEEAPPSKGPRRRLYRTTDAGREMLRGWLEAGPSVHGERHAFAAQVFLLDALGDPEASAEFIRALRAEFVDRARALAAVEGLDTEGRVPDTASLEDDEFHHYLTLRMGLRVAQARIEWCDEALDLIAGREGRR